MSTVIMIFEHRDDLCMCGWVSVCVSVLIFEGWVRKVEFVHRSHAHKHTLFGSVDTKTHSSDLSMPLPDSRADATHTYTRARTRARTHARTHACTQMLTRARARTHILLI